jgi:AraC family transcriptional regulator
MERRPDAEWLERPLGVISRLSAESRGWTGLNAALVEVSGGVSRLVVLARHNVTMLVSSPLRTTACCDDVSETRTQRPGDFDLLPAASSVSWIDYGYSTFFSVGLEHWLMRQTAYDLGVEPDRIAFEPHLTCRDAQIEHLVWALKAELEAEQPCGRLYADSLGIALASRLVRRWASVTSDLIPAGLPKRKLERVLAYVRDRIADDLALADIAAIAGVSPTRFKRLFKQSMGIPVHQYVMRRRVERATELLRRTNMPLSEVALQTGFANQSHMATTVRRAIGVTPKALRDAI